MIADYARDRWRRLALCLGVLLTGCGEPAYPAAACECVVAAPTGDSLPDRYARWRCVRDRTGADDGKTYTEAQCREYLASPWLDAPPEDDVAGRVVPRQGWPRSSGHGRPHDSPGCSDYCSHRLFAMSAACHGIWPEEPGDGVCLAGELAHRLWPFREVDEVRLALQGSSEAMINHLPCTLPLEPTLRVWLALDADGEVAWLGPSGSTWSTIPPLATVHGRNAVPSLPLPDVPEVLNRIRQLKTLGRPLYVSLGPDDDVPFGTVWVLWWAVDQELYARNGPRHRARETGGDGVGRQEPQTASKVEPFACDVEDDAWEGRPCGVEIIPRDGIRGDRCY